MKIRVFGQSGGVSPFTITAWARKVAGDAY